MHQLLQILTEVFPETNWDDHKAVVSASVTPSDMMGCTSTAELYDLVLSRNVLRKCADLEIGVDREAETAKLFFSREAINRVVNEKWQPGKYTEAIRDVVKSLIGEGPQFPVVPKITYGATKNLRKNTNLVRKLQDNSCEAALEEAIRLQPDLWVDVWKDVGTEWQECTSDKSMQVAKNAKINRFVCVTGTKQLAFQCSIGTQMRERFEESTGIDLSTIQVRHQRLARLGSLTQEIATLDSENASNSIAWKIVEQHFPENWVYALKVTRSSHVAVEFNGEEVLHKYEMAAPNGCGWTYEMETVLFYAIGLVAAGIEGGNLALVSTNGDDLIVPDGAAMRAKEILASIAVKTNLEKSYYGKVPFRESSGGDFLNGLSVRGIYVEKLPKTGTDWRRLCNKIYQRFSCDGYFVSDRARKLWFRCLCQIPRRDRLFGPELLGDSVITGKPEWWTTRTAEIAPCMTKYKKGDEERPGFKRITWKPNEGGRQTKMSIFVHQQPQLLCFKLNYPRKYETTWVDVNKKYRTSHTVQSRAVVSGHFLDWGANPAPDRKTGEVKSKYPTRHELVGYSSDDSSSDNMYVKVWMPLYLGPLAKASPDKIVEYAIEKAPSDDQKLLLTNPSLFSKLAGHRSASVAARVQAIENIRLHVAKEKDRVLMDQFAASAETLEEFGL